MKISYRLKLILICGLLSSCATYNSESSYVQNEREQLYTLANKGDAEAQYQLGQSWCCGDDGRFFSTKEAIRWWCKAAAQENESAIQALEKQKVSINSCQLSANLLLKNQ